MRNVAVCLQKVFITEAVASITVTLTVSQTAGNEMNFVKICPILYIVVPSQVLMNLLEWRDQNMQERTS